MRLFRYALAIVMLAALATPALASSSFDVCVDPATAETPDGGLNPGQQFVAVGKVFKGGDLGTGVAADCTTGVTVSPIGTFFVFGNVVATVGAAGPDDSFYVNWHFRIDGHGEFDTTGIVKDIPYTQTIVGSTSPRLAPANGLATVMPLSSGFQFRITLPSKHETM